MAIETITSKQALANRKSNDRSSWPNPKKGAEHLFPIPLPQVKQTFKINRNDRIFCIGSCFAREIEKTLKQSGFTVTSADLNIPSDGGADIPADAYLNKYTIHSILTELKLALEPGSIDPSCCFAEVSEGVFQDHQLAGSSLSATFDKLSSIRADFSRQFANIRDANVVVLTLGLSEVWFDRESNLYLNKCPDLKTLKFQPNRFELRVLDYPETLQGLEDIQTLLQRHLRPGFRLLLTVSPVPLLSTFRETDIFEANTYSKSVLRVAAEAFVNKYKNVNYFPSYEMATLGPQDAIWGGRTDFRHVNRHFVEVIMYHALEAFMEEPPEDLGSRKVKAMTHVLLNAGRTGDALIVLERSRADPELEKLRRSVEKTISAGLSGSTQKPSLLISMEKWALSRILKGKYLRKYVSSRYSFFADSSFALLRLWGKVSG